MIASLVLSYMRRESSGFVHTTTMYVFNEAFISAIRLTYVKTLWNLCILKLWKEIIKKLMMILKF